MIMSILTPRVPKQHRRVRPRAPHSTSRRRGAPAPSATPGARELTGNRISYELPDALVRRINDHDPGAFERFLLTATREDRGESAANDELGHSLVVYVEEVLGEGPWLSPQ
jgi:hypothetical protein